MILKKMQEPPNIGLNLQTLVKFSITISINFFEWGFIKLFTSLNKHLGSTKTIVTIVLWVQASSWGSW
jgi:hypothetical protein